ncbi:glycerol kinase GlpK [Chloroflexota bacterium]
MPAKNYILAIDQGTTRSTAVLLDREGQVVSIAHQDICRIYPNPGWVEQEPQEIFQKSLAVAHETLRKAGVTISQVAAVGITNQRETTVIWDRYTGEPVCNAIVWQCRRTSQLCDELSQKGMLESIKEKTGLVIDPYFSATKIRWILDHIPQGQYRAEQGDLLFGTIDSWLVWKLTNGALHITDYSNASRTMLFNINSLQWDKELLAALNIPEIVLPIVMPSSCIYGEVEPGLLGNTAVPLGAIIGDQQSALFGQACYQPGMVKNTYGTGSFMLLNTGDRANKSVKGLVTTIAWELTSKVTYAMEGSIFVTGAAIQWLKDGLGLIDEITDSEALACSVSDSGEVYFIPAFSGLGAPYWDTHVRGTILGITQSTTKAHLARAILEAIAYQTHDVMEVMKNEANVRMPLLRVDGGVTENAFLMQFQADILGVPIQVASVSETTALGAAYLAGLAVGYWRNTTEIEQCWHSEKVYEPTMSVDRRETMYYGWKRAIERTRSCYYNEKSSGNSNHNTMDSGG